MVLVNTAGPRTELGAINALGQMIAAFVRYTPLTERLVHKHILSLLSCLAAPLKQFDMQFSGVLLQLTIKLRAWTAFCSIILAAMLKCKLESCLGHNVTCKWHRVPDTAVYMLAGLLDHFLVASCGAHPSTCPCLAMNISAFSW